ncbi:MAG TPA: MlaD family protein [Solirubrobacteraceae bacterium]|nr:MlaD family protein [Solirubrobacteraceae bacterium]
MTDDSADGPTLDRPYAAGDRLAAAGRLDEAQAAYEQASGDGDGVAAAKLGLLREHRGDRAGALAAYRAGDDRGNGFAALRLGLLLAAHGQWQEAEEAFARGEERGQEQPGFDLAGALRHESGPAPAAAVAAAPSSALASPVLVGALAVLLLVVGVFLAYNANNGLPFVPTRELKVDIASGSDLVIGNEVREGGFRIGLISDMQAVRLPSGQVGAQLTLQLDQAHGSVPVDSTASIRPRSVLGLKYIDLHLGSARRQFADGATMPITHTRVPVQFEDVFQAFDAKTRSAIDKNLVGFGDAFAARGSALNDTFASLPRLLYYLQPVTSYLADPNTKLTRFLGSLEGFMGTIAPVAGTNARLFTDMATTFAAISRDPGSLEQTIAKSPSTEQVSTESLRAQGPFLADLSTLGHYLAPATRALAQSLPTINPAIETGTRTLARTPSLNANLQQVMNQLQNLAQAPGTNLAINALTATSTTLNPMIRYLGPYQTVCDDWNYFWTYLGEHLSQPTDFGFAQRVLINVGNSAQPNNVGQAGAIAPVNGGGSDSLTGGNEYYHGQVYGAAVDNQGHADCETGQRGFVHKLNYGDPQGRLLATDPHIPGDQGATFAGRARVPAGETFSRNPATGPQLSTIPGNS